MSDLSKKAQETRKLVLKTPEERASEKADEVFDWILSYFEKSLNIVLSEKSITFSCSKFREKIYIGDDRHYYSNYDYEYDDISLELVTSEISVDDFLDILKERIEHEEGFKCKLEDTDDPEEKDITVTIE